MSQARVPQVAAVDGQVVCSSTGASSPKLLVVSGLTPDPQIVTSSRSLLIPRDGPCGRQPQPVLRSSLGAAQQWQLQHL